MTIEVQNTAGLIPYAVRIEEIIKDALKEIEGKLSLGAVQVVVKETEHPDNLKDIGGVGGYCPNGKLVELSVDVNNPLFQKSWEQLIRRSLLHELHHAARRQVGIATGESSFLECLFSEGLADHFVYDITGTKPVWVIDLEKEARADLLERAKEIFNQPVTDKLYNDWFIEGSKELNIPHWAGYALGYKLVNDYLVKHPDNSAVSLVSTPVSAII
ncbi:DUF2268 domain-containing protein [Patescibacteria group bacterium]|nr:DUF2268 domain-containing protein [Patescibacteria group bacterium]